MLWHLRAGLDFDDPQQRSLWGATLLGFFFLWRKSEYLHEGSKPAKHGLCVRDIRFTTAWEEVATSEDQVHEVHIKLTSSKTDQRRGGVTLRLSRSGSFWLCPIPAIWELRRIAIAAGAKADESLCTTLAPDGTRVAINESQVKALLRDTARRMDKDPSAYSTHSLRSGGATALFKGGATDLAIQKFGRWRSDAFKSYAHIDDVEIAQLAGRIAFGGTASPHPSPKSSLAAFRLSKVPTFVHNEDDKLAPAVHVRNVEGKALHGDGSVSMRVAMFTDALGSKESAWVYHLMSTKKFVPATMTEKDWDTLVDEFYTEYIGDKTYRESMYEKVTQKDGERFTEYVMRVALWAAVAGQQLDEERKIRIVVQGVVDRQLHAALWQISEDSLSWDEFEPKAKRLMASADAHARKTKTKRAKAYRVAQATAPMDVSLQVNAARTGGPPSHGNVMPAAAPTPFPASATPAPSAPGRTVQGCHVYGEPGHYRSNCPQAQHLASCDFHGAHIGHTSDDCNVLKNARRYAEAMMRAQAAQPADNTAGTSPLGSHYPVAGAATARTGHNEGRNPSTDAALATARDEDDEGRTPLSETRSEECSKEEPTPVAVPAAASREDDAVSPSKDPEGVPSQWAGDDILQTLVTALTPEEIDNVGNVQEVDDMSTADTMADVESGAPTVHTIAPGDLEVHRVHFERCELVESGYPQLLVPAVCDGEPSKLLFDTGAMTVKGVGGGHLAVLGQCLVTIQLGQSTFVQPFVVCPGLTHDGILGMDFVLTHGVSMISLRDEITLQLAPSGAGQDPSPTEIEEADAGMVVVAASNVEVLQHHPRSTREQRWRVRCDDGVQRRVSEQEVPEDMITRFVSKVNHVDEVTQVYLDDLRDGLAASAE
ncbi:hypothetical protein SPRG_22331 [Saprolegnia parasitica CBS 223.65]|uniref:Uncharacterized protein n=1 Tax=Saprolegnia parasitica (strain CBS 223.65) TaxID=695850 RepID=A0A067BQ25_SAPPC|nr:hypothetical protein SPRG_22331 [Saprolegnia parasitica CBS 223.65]KDO20594.1 hypothetical protein SPRG_22331 [Saprolegnia parasitica CBS 223.65]|eukprot:XP_012208722.1 hypothetical protein SPRG_22331 [Saprolegnia parasitica CBS 223.65]